MCTVTCKLQPVLEGILRGWEGLVMEVEVVRVVVCADAEAGSVGNCEDCSIL